jgi:cytochrome P450
MQQAQSTQQIPLMPGWPLVGNAHRLWLNPLGLYADAFRAKGEVVKITLGQLERLPNLTGTFYLLFNPNDVKDVFTRERRVHREVLRRFLGTGLFINQTGDMWRRQRRLLQPAFHMNHLSKLVDTMTATVGHVLDGRWREHVRTGRPIDLVEEMKHLTVQLILRLMFGSGDEVSQRLGEGLGFMVDYLDKQLFDKVKVPSDWPTAENRRFPKELAELDAFIYRTLEQRRANPEPGEDLFSMFMLARDDKGEGMSDKELRDEVISTFIAGTETTGSALSWAFYLLASNPQTAARLGAESQAVLGERTPRFEDVSRLSYARMVIQESLRLYPPAWAMIRFLEEDRQFGGYHIPANSSVLVSPYVTHRHPAYWEDPERFDPERFSPERSANRPRFAYFPFGGGPHQCIGNELALMESQLILSMMAQRYRLELEPGQRIRPRPTIALAPNPSPRMRVIPVGATS